jgi:integrase
MACITKIRTKAGAVRFRAIIKRNGRQIASKNFQTKTPAVAWARRLEADAELMSALGTPEGTRTFAEAAAALVKATPERRDTTRQARIDWWTAKIGAKLIGRIELADLRAHLDEYAKTHKPATVNRLKAAASSVFRFAMQQGWLTRNPAAALAHRAENNARTRWLSDEERKALLTACEASGWPKLRALVMVLLGTGCRLGEALSLRWSDLDWTERTAHLARTKNGTARVLSFPEPVLAELRKHKPADGVVVDLHRPAPAALIFAGSNPDKVCPFRRYWDAAVKAAQIERCRIHDLRHSAASYLALSGASLLEIAEVLGHRSVQTTKRYAHLSTAHKQALTDRVLGGLL